MTKREKNELYDILLRRQGGVCAICGCVPGNKKFAIDHDHKTDKIRGLLCFGCNVAVGFLRDDLELMFCAAEYVNEEQWEVQDMIELNKAWRNRQQQT